MDQRRKAAQPLKLGLGEVSHIRKVLTIRHHGAKSDQKNLRQPVEHPAGNAGIRQGGKQLMQPCQGGRIRARAGRAGSVARQRQDGNHS